MPMTGDRLVSVLNEFNRVAAHGQDLSPEAGGGMRANALGMDSDTTATADIDPTPTPPTGTPGMDSGM